MVSPGRGCRGRVGGHGRSSFSVVFAAGRWAGVDDATNPARCLTPAKSPVSPPRTRCSFRHPPRPEPGLGRSIRVSAASSSDCDPGDFPSANDPRRRRRSWTSPAPHSRPTDPRRTPCPPSSTTRRQPRPRTTTHTSSPQHQPHGDPCTARSSTAVDRARADAGRTGDGRPRRQRRERRPAQHRHRPAPVLGRLPVDGQRLRAAQRRIPPARRPDGRPVRPAPHVPDRPRRVHARLAGLRPRRLGTHADPGPRRPGRRRRHAHPGRDVDRDDQLRRTAARHRTGPVGHRRQHGHRRRRPVRRHPDHRLRLARRLLHQRAHRRRRPRRSPAQGPGRPGLGRHRPAPSRHLRRPDAGHRPARPRVRRGVHHQPRLGRAPDACCRRASRWCC